MNLGVNVSFCLEKLCGWKSKPSLPYLVLSDRSVYRERMAKTRLGVALGVQVCLSAGERDVTFRCCLELILVFTYYLRLSNMHVMCFDQIYESPILAEEFLATAGCRRASGSQLSF